MGRKEFDQVYAVVRQIPRGKVATYGQIAFWLGWTHGARTVGWALRATPGGQSIPWHRVINSKGQLSAFDDGTQRALLETEGLIFDEEGRVTLRDVIWAGPPELDPLP